ncbi:hypothetical protein HMF8227_01915 [Saliniradius amylolyticus]|uniref:Uncharacterized protein n=1 Tax=Saliniradius amylolyticus TaxID=2183582 RepID=A0A2S2E411_9ALTE|nr:transporter substrate-binding domain-containing protein [Saliniradius amylolyticus]AWL12385.1 hypothetical protein HMF8227_01915 [Saliniradius amylolyticus]
MKHFLLLLILTLAPYSLNAETWKITSLEWPPYSGKDLPGQGTAVEELRSVLKQKGINLEVEFYPWKRAQEYAANPDYVGYFPAWPEEVGKGFMGSKGVQNSSVSVLYRQGNDVSSASMMDLFSSYKVGLIKTYVYPDAIEQAAKKHPQNVDLSPNEQSLLKKLSAGRMDAAITDPKVMMYYADQSGVDNIKAAERAIETKPLVVSFAARDDNKARLELLNSLIK